MQVKICGIQTVEAAQIAADAGADYIGFVFAPSKRKISPKKAAMIVKQIDSPVKKVGVFVNEAPENINRIAHEVGLDIIQLHGDELPSIVNQLAYPTIKAYSIDQVIGMDNIPFPSNYLLIDSPPTIYRGGSGKIFDWQLAKELPIPSHRLILAGGLTPENVQQAIATVQPACVDVSSGVETNGEKDHEKIIQFIANAKG